MRLITLLVATLGTLAAAQSGANPLVPIVGPVTAGQPVTIKWTPTTSGTISLQLRWGISSHLEPGTAIVASAANSGSYTWTPPTTLPAGSDYTVQITDDTNKEATNYSPVFAIISYGAPPGSSSMMTYLPSSLPPGTTPSMPMSTITKTSAVTTVTGPGTTKGTITNTGSIPSGTMPTGTDSTSDDMTPGLTTSTSVITTPGSNMTVSATMTKSSGLMSSMTPKPSDNSGPRLGGIDMHVGGILAVVFGAAGMAGAVL